MYTPMDPRAMKEMIATRDALMARLHSIAERRAKGDAMPACPRAARRPPTPMQPPTKQGKLAVPVMTAAEAQAATINWSAVAQAGGGAALRDVVATHGFAIIEDVVCAEENRILEALWANDLAGLSADVKYNRDPSFHNARVKAQYEKLKTTEGPRAWPTATMFHDKFSYKRGLVHGGYSWAARLHPNVRRVFSHLLEEPEDNLCVGTDNVFFTPAPAAPLREDRYWMHSDLNEHAENGQKPCFQSILYTWDATDEGCATTVVWPKSHTATWRAMMNDDATRGNASNRHFVTHKGVKDKALKAALVKGSNDGARRVPVPAGALLVWDSRLSHQGWGGGSRLAQPVCWEQRDYRGEAARRRKLWLAATGMPSTHWATLGKCHTRQEGIIEDISAATPPDASVGSADDLLFPCYGSIVPYGVDPARLSHWHKVVPQLWQGGSADRSCEAFRQPEIVEKFLRPEVLAVL